MKKHMIYINFEDYDFVVEDFKEKFYIQVVNILSDGEVVKRKFGAYDNENDNYPKYVLTMDKIDYSRNGIIHKDIIKYLKIIEFYYNMYYIDERNIIYERI